MSDVRFEGLLQKPGRIPGRKTKVWCVLSDQELLFYRENKRSSCIGSLELSLVRKVEKVVSNERDFRVDYKGKLTVYTAEDSAKRDEWIANLLDALQANCYNKQVPLAQNTVKCKLDTSRKQTLQDQGEISIQSRILSRKPSGVNNTVPRINDQPTLCEKNISQGGQNSSRKEGPNLEEDEKPEVKKTFAKETTAVAKGQPSNESQVFISSGSSKSKEAVSVKTDTIRKNCVHKAYQTVNKEGESTTNFETEAVNSRRFEANGKNKQESFDLTKNIVGRSSIVHSTEKESRPDSGYETLAGSENRRSIITEEYGEVDITRVVMRRSRRSINSFTMNNSETEVPKVEQVPVSSGIKETKTTKPEQNPLRENHIEEENCDDLTHESAVSNGDFHADPNEESDTVYENIASLRKEKTLENSVKTVSEEKDVFVPMRRSGVSKRTTLVDMHVPQVVVEDEEEDDENVNDVIPPPEGQEEMLMNISFEPIEELPFKGKDMQSDEFDFSEIREILSHRKSPIRDSVSLDPVEELRKLLEQV